MSFRILEGDCRGVMRTLPESSIDAIVTDPPYGLSFMGKGWDHGVPGEEFWVEALRVAKPGAHLVAFGGTRTYHRLTVGIDDAGWEIRDCLSWLYGSGFPKSLDVAKALDKNAGYWRGAAEWDGWGTALKPAWEPIILARKPFKGTVASNVQEHGTGALNIDTCRIEGMVTAPGGLNRGGIRYEGASIPQPRTPPSKSGRWPANVVLDEDAAKLLDEASGESVSRVGQPRGATSGDGWGMTTTGAEYNDFGGASRFFYTAKASRGEREAGLREAGLREAVTEQHIGQLATVDGRGERRRANHHPTVKPLALMQWLCRLITPKGGSVLDPFCGSGSTGRAAVAEGFSFVGIELDPEYAAIARARIADYAPLFTEDTAA